MTTEQWGVLIGAVVLVLTNLAALIKVLSDNAKIKSDRSETKAARDRDSEVLHDQCQRNTWDIDKLKDENAKRDTILDSLRCNVNELNTNLLLVSQRLELFSNAVISALNSIGVKEGK